MLAKPLDGYRTIAGRNVRWNAARAKAAYDDGWWTSESLGETLRRAAQDTPSRVVIVDGDHRLDCEGLYQQASALARAMLARAPSGSVISFMLPNWHEAAAIYLGASLAGMVAHLILPSLRDRELGFMLREVQSRIVFVPAWLGDHDYIAMLERVGSTLESPPEVVVVRGDAGAHTPYDRLLQTPPDGALPKVDPDAVSMVLYTSGTSGTPKGVMHTHNSIHALLRQIGQNWLVEAGDSFLVPSPISHIGGSIYAFEAPLLLGTRAVLMERWDPAAAVQIAEREGCSHMAGATPFLTQLLAAAGTAGTRLPRLKLFICGGASVAPTLVRRAAAYFECTAVTRVYGSTEAPVTTVGVPDRGDLIHAAETDGRVGVTEVKLVDEAGNPDQRGEILVRGPQILAGYWRQDDDVAAFDEAGYFRTGDIGQWVDGHYLVVSGRSKDIIIRNGENISPKEVEDCLAEHPGIAEVSIVGLPDARTGERACAVIVPRRHPGPDLSNLSDFLGRQGVARFKFPEQIALLSELPKNDAGKVLKHRIRAMLSDQDNEA